MERQKREKNSIIIHFVFYFVLTIWIITYGFISLLPKVTSIEKMKLETKDLYNNLTKIEKTWLTFQEFKDFNNTWTNSKVIEEILKSMTEDFYNKNLVNKTYASYKEFLENKSTNVNSIENKKLIEEKTQKISKILPLYSDSSIDFSENSLTDYKFVNYVESIIETFNLNTTNPIGISKVDLLEDFTLTEAKGDSLDSNIYYVPLTLGLKWTKSWILDFLYFIENVGNINIEENNININNNYWFLSKNWVKKVLEWDKQNPSYNIFEHQIIDIEKISMSDYIDSTYVSKGDSNFRDFIVKTQWNEEYEINVNLLFYVKWLPTYKIEEFISNILDKHKDSMSLINISLKDTKIDWVVRINLLKDNDVLNQLNNEIITMRKSLATNSDLEELYKRVIKIDEIIDPIYKKLKK